ncbi:C4-dicarboxylate ABC transporter [Bifidobacterium sp.]|uniref:C4-dicarboxylate ABC transporter n=1 Tax=Bifidobacterium sp. TaxID=41200 RepID=UPI00386FCE26
MNALPAILWIIGAAVALLVCAVTVMSSHYRDGRANEVRPVTWTVIGGHVASFVLLAAPYVVYLANSASIGAHARSLYTKLGWASAAVAVALVMVELVLMYLQARRAMLAQEARASVQQDVPAPSERCGSDGDDGDDKPSSLW